MAKLKFFKFCALALCVCVAPVFAGCTLVTTNVDKQLGETVAKFNNSITVTREELLITYNSTGNSRFDNSSAVTENGIRSTIDLELKRKILVDFLTSDDMSEARAEFNVEKVTLSTKQINDTWQGVYDYINDSVKELEDELRGGKEASDEETSSYKTYEDSLYSKTYTLVEKENKYQLEKVLAETEVSNSFIGLYTEEDVNNKDLTFTKLAKQAYDTFRENYWHWTDSIVLNPEASNEESFSDEAWSKYINNLLRGENDRNLTKKGEDAFLRNVQLVYGIYYQNAILSAFQTKYTEENINVTVKNVADKYSELYAGQKEKYDTDPAAFNSKVATDSATLYYRLNPSNYFEVNHILVKFSDEQNKAIEAEKKKLENGEIDADTYKLNVQSIKMQTMATDRETGEKIPYAELKTLIENKVREAGNDSASKVAAFAELMHRFSEDDATLGAESSYYVPVSEKTTSSFQEPFVEGSREAYNEGNGKIGDMTSTWYETSYGYHMIMYTGNPINVDANCNSQDLVVSLNAMRLNPLYNKTMLDKVIEQITLDEYADFEEALLDYLMGGKEVIYYPGSFSDLYS